MNNVDTKALSEFVGREISLAKANPHGCGFATKDKVFKSLNFVAFCNELHKVKKEEACLIHFRFATHGSVCVDNCHPFYDGETGISFAHNGVLDIESKDDKTDSEIFFREKVLPTIKKFGIESRKTYNVIEKWRGSSKFAFLTSSGEIFKFGTFVEKYGCLFSNKRWFAYMHRDSSFYPSFMCESC